MAAPDMSPLMAAVDFETVVWAILNVALAWLTVECVWFGCRVVVSAVRGTFMDDFVDRRGDFDVKDDPLAGIDDDIRRASK